METQPTSAPKRSLLALGPSRQTSALAGLLASLALHLAPGPAAAQVVVSPVAISGTVADQNGDTYRSFGTGPVLNASGQVAYAAVLNVANFNDVVQPGIFVGVPGSPPAIIATNSSLTLAVPLLNASGQVAFLDYPSLPGPQGILAGAAASIQTVAVYGSAAPAGGNYDNGGNQARPFSNPVLNAAGQVAFYSGLAGGTPINGPSSPTDGIFAGVPGALQAVAIQGQFAPGTGGNIYGSGSGTAFGPPVINSAGQVAFQASIGGSFNGIFMGAPGSVQAAVLAGGAAPGGNFFTGNFGSPVLNASGQLAFRDAVQNFDGTSFTNGIFVGVPGSIQAAALQGTAASAGGNYNTFGANPVLNSSGQVAFLANLTGGSSTSGIFTGLPGSVQAVGLQGLLAPAGNGATYNTFGGFVLDASDQVAFIANLNGTGVVTGNNQGLYAGSPGDVLEIVRKGDLIDFGDGTGFHTVSSIGFNTGSGGEDGRGISLNDSGMLVYELSFTDGTSGIFESQIGSVPEPGTLALVGAAAVVWLVRRKR